MNIYQYQENVISSTWDEPYLALNLEMGLGKSRIAIKTAERLFLAGRIRRVLIVAPKSLQFNWVNELKRWLAVPFYARIVGYKGRVSYADELSVLICTYEFLRTEKGELADDFAKGGSTLGILDESHYIKSPSAARTKAALHLSRLLTYRRILTGTLITNKPLDVYSQYRFLSGSLFPESFFSFRARYCELQRTYVSGRSFDKEVGWKNLDELRERIAPVTVRILKEEVLDLPKKRFERITVALSPEQRKLYSAVTGRLEVLLPDGDVLVSSNVLTEMLHLQQITGGFLDAHSLGTNPKLDALIELLEGEFEGKQVIIWARFIQEVEAARDVILARMKTSGDYPFKQQCGLLHGGIPMKDRAELIDRFQNGDVQYIIGTPMTGGVGINATASSSMVYLSNTFSLTDRLQSADRIHRIGQTQTCTYVDIVAGNTIDEVVLEALQTKGELSNAVLQEIAKRVINQKRDDVPY